jgi:hypothetical protein
MADDAVSVADDVPLSYSFVTSAKAAVDARALEHPRLVTFDIVLDGAALAVAVVLLAAGQPLLGLAIGAIAGLSLAGARWHPLQRWLIRVRSGALLGQTLTVTLEDGGVRYASALGESFVQWEGLTEVRFDASSVAFFRESFLTGYLPTEAFPSIEERDRVVAVARARIAAARKAGSTDMGQPPG